MSEITVRENLQKAIGLVHFSEELWEGESRPKMQALFRFENSYGASVISGPGSTYGVELAVVLYKKDAPVTGDPVKNYESYSDFSSVLRDDDRMSDAGSIAGYLTEERLMGLLETIGALPSPYQSASAPSKSDEKGLES